MSGCPFALLGISKDKSSEKSVLRAWRRRMRENHPDKKAGGESVCLALNEAKERALADLKSTQTEDQERAQVEEATGIRINEDRLDDMWEILTGQQASDDASITAEQNNPTPAKWMDKRVFRQDIFRMMRVLGR
jgi:hypothetical protein